jgi:hypothetical protein
MRVSIPAIVAVLVITVLPGCESKQPESVAKQQGGHTPQAPSIDCEVTSGPNKGKRGKRTEDGWCVGDWGGTECRPRSKCKDVETGGAVAATEVERPDLEVDPGAGLGNPVVGIVPPRGSAPHEYCRREDGFLSVVFTNTGSLQSPGNVNVNVTFATDPEQTVTVPMPPIPAGGTVEMSFEIPPGCFSPDCSFTIQWSNQPEVGGLCIG